MEMSIILKRWNKNEIEFLKENYKTMSIKELANILNRTPKSVRGKIETLGISLKELNRQEIYNWSDEDILFLKENYKIMTDEEIAIVLFNDNGDKARARVFRKRHSLGLEKDKRGMKYNYDNNKEYVSRFCDGIRYFEHRENAEIKLGRKLKDGEIVHHIDGNKRNNELYNLCVLENAIEHKKLHAQLEEIARELFIMNIIKFDENKKEYYINDDFLK